MSTAPAPVPLIDVKGLVKQLGVRGRGFRLRVDRLSISRGSFVAITGRSGCGKSTLLDMLALIAAPTVCDRFTFAGAHDISALWNTDTDAALSKLRRRHMGYVLQQGALCSFLSVGGNLDLPRRMNALGELGGSRDTALASLDMTGMAHRDVRSLSGGERQRIAVLRALAHGPDIIFADEPTGALDYATAQRVLDLLAGAAAANGATVVMVTHDSDLARRFATHHVTFSQIADPAGIAAGEGDTVYLAEMA